jgi:Lsr2
LVARFERVVFTCDVDDSAEDVETVSFSFNGTDYVTDLCAEHRKPLTELMHEYISAARYEGATRRPRAKSATADAEDLAAIRGWGRANGFAVSERGRVPGAVKEAFHAANG